MADPDILLRDANLICFSVSPAYFFVGGRANVYSQSGCGAMARFPHGSATIVHYLIQPVLEPVKVNLERLMAHHCQLLLKSRDCPMRQTTFALKIEEPEP